MTDVANSTEDDPPLWQTIYMSFVLLFAFVALLSDRIGADMVMASSLTLSMASGIVSVEEGVAGFANEGVLTVSVLFVVAAGIHRTGALDWYLGRALGNPSTLASAQLRLMVPVAIVSAFLNNTPVVAVTIPVVIKWGESTGLDPRQLLIPLSFASILGGTCTLIGTSTNLVVAGLLEGRYGTTEENFEPMGLFDLGVYGVPVAVVGTAYVLCASTWLLPNDKDGSSSNVGTDDLLLGARLTQWSPAAGRTVNRSGLRDTGGIYLVSVYRHSTGNVHRAVGRDFVLNVGDVLYFTSGYPEGFAAFCNDNGLEVVTSESEGDEANATEAVVAEGTEDGTERTDEEENEVAISDDRPKDNSAVAIPINTTTLDHSLRPIREDDVEHHHHLPPVDVLDVGTTRESLARSDHAVKMRIINRLTDVIRDHDSPSTNITHALAADWSSDADLDLNRTVRHRNHSDGDNGASSSNPGRVVVVREDDAVVIGVETLDRPGLVHDISRGIVRLGLQCRSTEAAVVDRRSISVWRCSEAPSGGKQRPRLSAERVWSVLDAVLQIETGVEAHKRRGLSVVRAVVRPGSRLARRGATAGEAGFAETYRAALVAVRRGGRRVEGPMSKVVFEAEDTLILQARDDSPLLRRPPKGFYENDHGDDDDDDDGEGSGLKRRTASFGSMLHKMVKTTLSLSQNDLVSLGKSTGGTDHNHSNNTPPPPNTNDYDDVENGLFWDDADQPNTVETTPIVVPQDNVSDIDDDERSNDNEDDDNDDDDNATAPPTEEQLAVWRDLQVAFVDDDRDADDPDNDAPVSSAAASREFLTAVQVTKRSGFIGKTAVQSGLDKLSGVYLVDVERPVHDDDDHNANTNTDASSVRSALTDDRSEHRKPAPSPLAPDAAPLAAGDVLWYSGPASRIGDLRKIPGLALHESDEIARVRAAVHNRRLVQAVVARAGPLVGTTVVEARFRTRYGAAVIAVGREGRRVHEHPGRVRLRAGDVLLLEAGPTFSRREAGTDRSFALLREVEDSAPPRLRALAPASAIAVVMLAVFTAGAAPLLVCAAAAAMCMVVTGILSQQEVRDAIHWDVYVTIASAFGIGSALTNSGIAADVANLLVGVGRAVDLGAYAGLYGAVYLATTMLSNVVTNNAAAALVFPIAMDAVEKTGADRTIMSYALMLGASASFMSPFGYTTNLLIFGPGGYKTMDFLRFGTPMQIVLWIVSILFLSLESVPWYATWIGSVLVLLLVVLFRSFGSRSSPRKRKKG